MPRAVEKARKLCYNSRKAPMIWRIWAQDEGNVGLDGERPSGDATPSKPKNVPPGEAVVLPDGPA